MITVRLMVTRKTCSLITTIPTRRGTYNLQDVIDKLNAEETSDSIRSLSQDQLIQLTNEKKDGWIYSAKTRLSTKLYLVVVVERCCRWKFLHRMMGDQ